MGEKPNVLLIVIDCLRSDRIFGRERTCKTPTLDRLVETGTAFPNVFVENSITAPSFASIFTGRYGARNGIVGMVGVRLGEDVATLAEIFASNGYETYAEVTGPLSPILGLARGFGHYHYRNQQDYFFTGWGKGLLDRLVSGALKEPFLLVVHFWEVHVPRQVPPGFDSPEFGSTPYDRAVSGLDAYLGKLLDAVPPNTAVILTSDHGECVGEIPPEGTLLHYFLDKLNLPPPDVSTTEGIDATVDLMKEQPELHRFAAEILQSSGEPADGLGWRQRLRMMATLLRIGFARYRIQAKRGLRSGLFADLKQKLGDISLFVNVARGNVQAAQVELVRNSLSEHRLQHGYHVYDYLQRVPVVFSGTDRFPEGYRVDTVVRHIDLLPTMIQAFGLTTTAGGFDGSSYYDQIVDGPGEDRSVHLEARSGAQSERVFLIRGIRHQGWKLAYAPFEPSAPVECYDLDTDPSEQRNLATVEPERVALLREEVEQGRASLSSLPSARLSADENMEMVRKLKSLGYL